MVRLDVEALASVVWPVTFRLPDAERLVDDAFPRVDCPLTESAVADVVASTV